MKFFLFFSGGGGGEGRGITARAMGNILLGYQVLLASGTTDTPKDSILGISNIHCHTYRKSIFIMYLLGRQEWLIKQPRNQNKAGGEMISKKILKRVANIGGRGTKRGLRSPLPSMVKLSCQQLTSKSKVNFH